MSTVAWDNSWSQYFHFPTLSDIKPLGCRREIFQRTQLCKFMGPDNSLCSVKTFFCNFFIKSSLLMELTTCALVNTKIHILFSQHLFNFVLYLEIQFLKCTLKYQDTIKQN